VDQVRSAAATASNYVHTTLSNGVDLSIPTVGLESSLLSDLRSGNKTPDPTRWYEFDRLTFDTNGATLQPQSTEQLNNIAAILKAYPQTRVKIGGYTDNTGDARANLSLSQRRADSVRQQLISMGIASERMEAEGYGSQHPVADNATEEGRAKNRRIALRITEY
jgi:outer membrane protein OmpA-like peptidoglycan-associated protein